MYGVPMHTGADEIGKLDNARWGEGLANARLIAAAPALLAALENIRETVAKRQLPITNTIWEIADEAIAQADAPNT